MFYKKSLMLLILLSYMFGDELVFDPSLKSKNVVFYKDNKNSVVISSDNLYWQDSPVNQTKFVNFNEAKKYCETISLGRFSNWRLPTFEELNSIVDRSDVHPAIKKEFEYVNDGNGYWSSTSNKLDKNFKMAINFQNGLRFWKSVEQKGYVRCVKNIQTNNTNTKEKDGQKKDL